jgi:hypothetical protein
MKFIYHRSSTLERVPAVVVGPSKLDGDDQSRIIVLLFARWSAA